MKIYSLNKNSALRVFHFILFFVFGLSWSCSKNNFSRDLTYLKCQNSNEKCISNSGRDYFSFDYSGNRGKVDILFINDNSASMSYEQSQLGDRFKDFVAVLDSSNLDYRIGIITTDISSSSNPPRDINQNGALQNGHLIKFSNSSYFIESDTGNEFYKSSLFTDAIVRKETDKCEKFILAWSGDRDSLSYSNQYLLNCPSGDERGIFAANLFVNSNFESFIRPNSNLVMIFLSDEDIRSQLYWWGEKGFLLESKDEPRQLIDLISSKYQNKNFKAHAIVTASESCLQDQNLQTAGLVSASYGLKYKELADLTGGETLDICSTNGTYTQNLGRISSSIIDGIGSVRILCKDINKMKNFEVKFLTNPEGISYSLNDNMIIFSKGLSEGTRVNISYDCEKL